MKFNNFFLSIIILMLLTSPVLADDEVVAVVGEQGITFNELEQVSQTEQIIMEISQINKKFAQLLYSSPTGQEFINQYRKERLEELINRELLEIEARKSNIQLTDLEKEQIFNNYLQQIKEENNLSDEQLEGALREQGYESLEAYKEDFYSDPNLIINIFLEKEIYSGIVVSDEEARKAYSENKNSYEHSARALVSHLFFESKDEAEIAYQRLEEGANFSQLARNISADQQSAQNNGLLGYIEKGQVDDNFEEVAFSLNPGEYSRPVQTQFGYHIIRTEELVEAGITPFEEIKNSIKNQLGEQKRQQVLNEYVKELRKEYRIERYL